VPAKPTWYRNLPYILGQLRNHPHPYVDRATLEVLLGIGRRRAQQIMAPCISDRVGANGLAGREALITRLERIAAGDDAVYEVERRQKVARLIRELRQERLEKPQLLVEAPLQVVHQELDNLPPGVQLERGRITVEFAAPQEALEKLLALAMAISNDFARFEHQVRPADG
jgi:hypothetical protein